MLHIAATWVVSYVMHSFITCVLALLVVHVFRIDAASRCVIWRSALLLPLLTAPIAMTVSRAGSADPRAMSLVEPVRHLVPPRWAEQTVEVNVTAINGRVDRRVTRVDDPIASTIALSIVVLAVVAFAAGAGRHRSSTSRMRRALRARIPTKDYKAIAARGISITESDLIQVPVALRGREICIPRTAFLALRESERNSVLLHEIAHIERRDPMWMDASRLLAAMTWWQPLNRVLCERLELDTESAADERAVALGARPQALVAGLAYFAGLLDAGFAGAGAALLHRDSPLVIRARLLLHPTPRNASIARRRLIVAGLIAAAIVMAALPVPTTAGSLLKPGQASGAPPGSRIAQEERDITIVRNDRQP